MCQAGSVVGLWPPTALWPNRLNPIFQPPAKSNAQHQAPDIVSLDRRACIPGGAFPQTVWLALGAEPPADLSGLPFVDLSHAASGSGRALG